MTWWRCSSSIRDSAREAAFDFGFARGNLGRMTRGRQHLLSLSVLALAACFLVSSVAGASEPRRIPVVFHVAQRDGEAVAPIAFVAEQLAAANEIYGALGIELVDAERVPLPEKHADLVTRADRDALAPYLRKGQLNCFVVDRLMDVDEPGRERRGVHWRPPPKGAQTLVIVSKISQRYVLAHELGHYFGNRQHSEVPGNLMSYAPSKKPRFLDGAQIRRVLDTLAALLKKGTLVPLADEPSAG